MAPNVAVIVGTYEEFLLGYKLDEKNEKQVLTQSFADKSHSGSLKCLAVQGRWVATGATDDRIFIYDMATRKQSQIILSHEGTINALAFTPDESHLLSGGDDGRMIATRLKTWFTEATWKKAHNGAAVTHISCHPSGKMALSLGSDLVLRTWNLVKGRVAYKTNLKSRNTLGALPDCLAWSPTGDYFTLSGQRVVEIWSIKSADVVHSKKTNAKPISVCWIADEICLVGLEDGKILWLNFNSKEEKETIIEAHKARVKTMCFHKDIVVTASSAGEIKMWQINETRKKLIELAATNIGCRPTCIGILDLEQFGADYVLSKKIAQKPEESTKLANKQKPQRERGVVTIEYENDDDEADEDDDTNDENDDNSDDNGENENDSVAEEEADEDDNEPEDEDNVEEEDDNNEVSDSEDAFTTSDDDDAEDNEPQIRLPKSRKRKQQVLNSQNQAKHAKLNSDVQKGKKQQKQPNSSTTNALQRKPKPKQKK